MFSFWYRLFLTLLFEVDRQLNKKVKKWCQHSCASILWGRMMEFLIWQVLGRDGFELPIRRSICTYYDMSNVYEMYRVGLFLEIVYCFSLFVFSVWKTYNDIMATMMSILDTYYRRNLEVTKPIFFKDFACIPNQNIEILDFASWGLDFILNLFHFLFPFQYLI